MAATKTRSKSHKKTAPAHESAAATRLGRPAWGGSISFGLVNIPVKLYPAVRLKGIRFHLLHEKDNTRVQEKLYCPADEKEIPRSEVIKGYEIGKNQHVVVTQEEIDSLAPKATHTIELLNVVNIKEIDPMYFDRPMYILPDERAGKAYYLLLEALQANGKGAIAKFVMRNKEYIGVIRPIKHVLCMELMHFADEIVSVSSLGVPSNPGVRDAEVKMAMQLLDSLESNFKPEQLHDDYREAMLKLIQKKAEGEEITVQPAQEEEHPEVIDLMSALKKSVEQAQRQKGRKAA